MRKTYDVRFSYSTTNKASARYTVYETDKSRTLSTQASDPSSQQGGVAIVEENIMDSASGTLTPWDVQSKRIQSVNGTAATLYGGAGQGTHNGAVFIPNKASCLTSRMDGSPCVDRGPQIE